MDPPKVPGLGGDHRDPWEFFRQVYADGLLQTSGVAPSGVEVPHADPPGVWIIHGPGGGGLGKKVYDKTSGTGYHLREAE